MNIRSAITRLRAIQVGLSITDPSEASVLRAYPYYPSRDSALPDCPCWINTWTLTREDRAISLREQFYTIHMQLFVDDADLDVSADLASAFMAEIVDALDADVTLNETVTDSALRGGDPTLALFEWGALSYIGLDLFLDLKMSEGADFA